MADREPPYDAIVHIEIERDIDCNGRAADKAHPRGSNATRLVS